MFEFLKQDLKKIVWAIDIYFKPLVIIVILAVLIDICGCKPLDVTSPIPTMERITMESSIDKFTQGTNVKVYIRLVIYDL